MDRPPYRLTNQPTNQKDRYKIQLTFPAIVPATEEIGGWTFFPTASVFSETFASVLLNVVGHPSFRRAVGFQVQRWSDSTFPFTVAKTAR